MVEYNLESCSLSLAVMDLYRPVYATFNSVIGPREMTLDPAHTGGYFAFWRCVGSGRGGHYVPVCGFAVGDVSTERFFKYAYFANEKAARLSTLPDHVSSWQSRNDTDPEPMRRRYGGAIRCGRYSTLIFAFSGFSELGDEAVCLHAALELGQIVSGEASAIVQASTNTYFPLYLPPAPRPGP